MLCKNSRLALPFKVSSVKKEPTTRLREEVKQIKHPEGFLTT